MRIDFIESRFNQYLVTDHFLQKLYEAMLRQRVDCRYIPCIEGKICFNRLDLPTFTLNFNGVPTDDFGIKLCDEIGVPHIAYLVDLPTWYYSLTESPHMIIACDDQSSCRFLDKIPFPKHLFLPHAVEADLHFEEEGERPYDVTFLATCYNFEQRRKWWQKYFPQEVCQAMDEAIEWTYSDKNKSLLDALIDTLLPNVPVKNEHDLIINEYFHMICQEVEIYLKGKERVALIKAFKNTDVHVFGGKNEEIDWKDEIGDRDHIHIHPPVMFEEAVQIMKKSKIILNSGVKNKEGAHERVFTGILSGAVVATTDCPFMQEHFIPEKEILLFESSKLDTLEDRIRRVLKDESLRQSIVNAGRQRVLNAHTWDHRAKTLLQFISNNT